MAKKFRRSRWGRVRDSWDRFAFRANPWRPTDVSRPSPDQLPGPLFVVVAPYRSGTNLLIRSMNEMGSCKVFSELFNPVGPLFGPPHNTHLNHDADLTRERNRDPLGFLERRLFSEATPGIGALGFKLMHDEARWGRRSLVRQWLRHHQSVRIVHLVRENFLEQLVSWRISCLNQQWVIVNNPVPTRPHEATQKPIPHFHLSQRTVRRHFERLERQEAEARMLATTHPYIEITYEALSSHFEETIGQVCDFLEISGPMPTPVTRKMTTQTPAEIVINYEDLKRQFAETRWGKFFV